MARAFTTSILFNGEAFMAVVTQIDGSVSVYLPDERLHQLLPHGRFTYNPKQEIRLHAGTISPLEELQTAIVAAVERSDQVVKTDSHQGG